MNTTIEQIQNQLTLYRETLSDAKSRLVENHLGSIRVIIDPDRQLLNANDFDAWGYYLDNRGYEMVPENETPDYKFTYKERDRESNYDYFGARYYDSRIGKWGQVEPLMDKYVSFSTYAYGLNNPIVMKDLDGRDARITIIRNTIEIEIPIYYVDNNLDQDFGASIEQISLLQNFKSNIENYWSGEFTIDGKIYNVNTSVVLEKITDKFNGRLSIDVQGAPETNIFQSVFGNIGEKGAGVSGQVLMVSQNMYKGYFDTGAHEAGHLMGLPDRTDPTDNPTMMHGHLENEKGQVVKQRSNPTSADFSEILKRNNINLNSRSSQIIKSHEKVRNK